MPDTLHQTFSRSAQLPHPRRPRLQRSLANQRLGNMVQHKDLLRMLVHKINRLRQMPLIDQNVVDQPAALAAYESPS